MEKHNYKTRVFWPPWIMCHNVTFQKWSFHIVSQLEVFWQGVCMCVCVVECGQWGRCLCHRGDLWACSVASRTVQDIVLWQWRVSPQAVRVCMCVCAGLQVSPGRHNQSTAGQYGPKARDHLTLAAIVSPLSLMNTGQVGAFVWCWSFLCFLLGSKKLSFHFLQLQKMCVCTLNLPPKPSHTPRSLRLSFHSTPHQDTVLLVNSGSNRI